MEIPSQSKYSLGKIALVLALLAIFALPSHAQTKEVEIEVAGPWTYAPHPDDPAQILLISPFAAAHKVDVFSGGDAYLYGKDATPGSYSLVFATACSGNAQSILKSKYIDFTVDAGQIKQVVGTQGRRYAISLPKPCYFETYLPARAILSQQPINPPQGEANYVVWMKLHYTVANGVTAAKFTGKPDNGQPSQVPQSISFAKSAKPPKAEAISIVLYDMSLLEDYDCDSYSAHFFDVVAALWGQQGWYRLFPELNSNHDQTEPYNATCSQQRKSSSAAMNKDGAMKSTKNKLTHLQQHPRTAGRADCHSTQVSLNGTVH